MLGAIIGDIVGSRWEFAPTNDYNFELFSDKNEFTDDTICTVAVADALLKGKDFGQSIHEWCRRYPHPKGGYGGRFAQWVHSQHPKPYFSFGNGAAMRVSPVAMWFQDAQEVRLKAEQTAACTHNHPEGLKGASAVAEAIHAALHACPGKTPDERTRLAREIATSVANHHHYDIEHIRQADVQNKFDETCQGTVPVALWVISQSDGFEDAVRRAVSLGADADTLGAIVGSIAEHIWGIPEAIGQKALGYLTDEMREVVEQFYAKAGTRPELEIDEVKFAEDCINWVMPGLQFFYRDTDAIPNAAEVYHVGQTIRAGFFIDVTTKLLKPAHKTRYLIASAHVARLYEIEQLVSEKPYIGQWNQCMLHYNSYFKVFDIYEKEGVTQVLLLHIPENMARLMSGLAGIEFITQAMGTNESLVGMARASLDEKLKMEVHPRSLDREWCERTKDPVGLTAQGDFFPLEPMPDHVNPKAANFGQAIHNMANDGNVEITWKEKAPGRE